MADDPPNELKAALSEGRTLIVCGAGVSMATTRGAAPGWVRLIWEGLAEATQLNGGKSKAWVAACEALLASDEVDDWLNAANTIQTKLGGSSAGPWRAFFKQRLGDLKVTNPAILDALKRLADAGNRIATTNYDHLISHALHWDRADWTNHVRVIEALRRQNSSAAQASAVIARSPCDEAIQGPRDVAPGLLPATRARGRNDGVARGRSPRISRPPRRPTSRPLVRRVLHERLEGGVDARLVSAALFLEKLDDVGVELDVNSDLRFGQFQRRARPIPISFLGIVGGLPFDFFVAHSADGLEVAPALAALDRRLRVVNRHAHDTFAFRRHALSYKILSTDRLRARSILPSSICHRSRSLLFCIVPRCSCLTAP
jgi:hypothetical protein